jgi:hypothetical protein
MQEEPCAFSRTVHQPGVSRRRVEGNRLTPRSLTSLSPTRTPTFYPPPHLLCVCAIQLKEAKVNLGLTKLRDGARDVEGMKAVLAQQHAKLAVATADTNTMLKSLERSSADAEKEATRVAAIRATCAHEAAKVQEDLDACKVRVGGGGWAGGRGRVCVCVGGGG